MSALLSSVVNKAGTGAPATRFLQTSRIKFGQILPVQINPPSGQRVRLTALSTENGVQQAGVDVEFNLVTLGGFTLNPEPTGGSLRLIGQHLPFTNTTTPPTGSMGPLTGPVDGIMRILFSSTTVASIQYAYEFVE